MAIDIVVVFAIIAFAVIGYSRGFIKSAASLIKASASVIVAFLLSWPVATFLNKLFGLSKVVAKIFKTDAATGKYIFIALVAIIIFVIIRAVLHWLVTFTEKSREKSQVFNSIDRWLGALFGLLRFVFMFSITAIIFYVITKLPFLKSLHTTVFKDSKVTVWLYNLVIKIILPKALRAAANAIK